MRRVHIPKGDGTATRPIGIPTFEDKVLQRAVAMVIGEVYEQEFHDFSYGFRPGRSAHQALEALRNAACEMAGGWLVEVDIRRFFDTVEHAHLREILGQRIGDGVLLRLIGKWLNAGILEAGIVFPPWTWPRKIGTNPVVSRAVERLAIHVEDPGSATYLALVPDTDGFGAAVDQFERVAQVQCSQWGSLGWGQIAELCRAN